MNGGKYGRAKHRRSSRSARKASRQLQDQSIQAGAYRPPPRKETEATAPAISAVSETTRLVTQFWYQGDRLVDFVLLHFVQIAKKSDGWYQLARVDCRHGTAHIHLDDVGAGRRNVRDLHSLNSHMDLWDAYDKAYSEIYEHWQKRERWFEDELGTSARDRPTGRLPEADLPDDCA